MVSFLSETYFSCTWTSLFRIATTAGLAPLPVGRPPIGGPLDPGGLGPPGLPGPPGPPGPPRSPGFGGGLGFGFGFGFGFGGFLPPRFGSGGFPCGFLPRTAGGPCLLGGLPHPGTPLGTPPLAGTPLPGAALPCAPLFGTAPLPGAALPCTPLFDIPLAGATPLRALSPTWPFPVCIVIIIILLSPVGSE